MNVLPLMTHCQMWVANVSSGAILIMNASMEFNFGRQRFRVVWQHQVPPHYMLCIDFGHLWFCIPNSTVHIFVRKVAMNISIWCFLNFSVARLSKPQCNYRSLTQPNYNISTNYTLCNQSVLSIYRCPFKRKSCLKILVENN